MVEGGGMRTPVEFESFEAIHTLPPRCSQEICEGSGIFTYLFESESRPSLCCLSARMMAARFSLIRVKRGSKLVVQKELEE